jgi:hypothetical protein
MKDCALIWKIIVWIIGIALIIGALLLALITPIDKN